MALRTPVALLNMKGPNGETTYTDGTFSVTIESDGAIHVMPGDWLSKYSAAMYGNFAHIKEFARMDRSGKLMPIENVNRINAGETLYHVPTCRKSHPRIQMDPILVVGNVASDDAPSEEELTEEQKKLLADALKAKYELAGETGEWLVEVSHIVHGVDGAATIAEVAGLIAEGTALATGTGLLAVTAGLLVSIGAGISCLNAYETDLRITGVRGICYGLTAWAFDHPKPRCPQQLKDAAFERSRVPLVERAWATAVDGAFRNQDAEVVKRKVSKQSFQALWKALGHGRPTELVRRLQESRAEELSYQDARTLVVGWNPDKYPN
jgi:hypothetical protein